MARDMSLGQLITLCKSQGNTGGWKTESTLDLQMQTEEGVHKPRSGYYDCEKDKLASIQQCLVTLTPTHDYREVNPFQKQVQMNTIVV